MDRFSGIRQARLDHSVVLDGTAVYVGRTNLEKPIVSICHPSDSRMIKLLDATLPLVIFG
jgi:hypothetical protein